MPLSAEPERGAVSPDRTVSVIIPALNEGRSIARLIHAIQQQAPAGWSVEVVLVDDGSTDDTVTVARGAGARVLELGRRAGGGNFAVRAVDVVPPVAGAAAPIGLPVAGALDHRRFAPNLFVRRQSGGGHGGSRSPEVGPRVDPAQFQQVPLPSPTFQPTPA